MAQSTPRRLRTTSLKKPPELSEPSPALSHQPSLELWYHLILLQFLSGGQSEEQASLQLSAMNAIENIRKPWFLSFSFGRALQNSSIKTWGGLEENFDAGQKAFLVRAKANSEAQLGKYKGTEDKAANESLFQEAYKY